MIPQKNRVSRLKKILACILLPALLSALLIGCGEPAEQNPPADDPAKDAVSAVPSPDTASSAAADVSDAVSSDVPPAPEVSEELINEVLNPGEEEYKRREDDGVLYYRLVNEKFYEVIGTTEKKSVVTVPSEFNGKPVLRVRGADEKGKGGAFAKTNTIVSSITFEEGVLAIGSGAFNGCQGLHKVMLPASLRKLEENAFSQLLGLETLDVREGGKYFRSIDGVLFSLDEQGELNELRFYPGLNPREEYTVPEGVKTFASDWQCSVLPNLRRMVLPSTITSLATETIVAPLFTKRDPENADQIFASPFEEVCIPSGVTGLQQLCMTSGNHAYPLHVFCADAERPDSWARNWCDSVTVVEWGAKW